jgi:hypothetical protein
MENSGKKINQFNQIIYILYTRTRWNEPPRARHQVAIELSRKNKTYFIEANKTGFPDIRRLKINKNLILLTPYWPLNYKIRHRIQIFNKLYQKYIISALGKIASHHLEIRMINFDHTATEIHKEYKNTIYYCNDYFIKRGNIPLLMKYFNNSEKKVTQNSIFCITTSDQLRNHLIQYNPNVHLIKLGGPKLEKSSFHIKNNYRSDKITVILLGFIYKNKTSIELLNKINKDKKIQMTVVGIADKRILKHMKNVRYKKPLIGGPLIEEINEHEIGIAPYPFNDDNIGRTPNKLWHYLALGKPVIVSDLPSLKNWKFPAKSVYVCKNEDEFIENIKIAHFENSLDAIQNRIKFAQKNTWENRIEKLYLIYNQYEKRQIQK